MAGHSKWANIRHRKGAQDARRGKIFTKVGKEITVAAKLGGPDPDSNPRLRLAITKARAVSMPKDNIERAIKRATGGDGDADLVEKVYEGYGPGGVAVLVECLTDNVNRTVSEVRYAFNKFGGNLGTDGSVAWMFHRKGIFVFEKDKIQDFEKLFELASENGAEDVREEDGSYEIECGFEDFNTLREALETLDAEADVAEISYMPENYSPVEDSKQESLLKLVELLEDNDDVQNVYHNGEISDS